MPGRFGPRLLRSKDVLAGALFVAFGIVGMLVGRTYPMGTAAQMEAGYLPVVISAGLLLLGGVILVSGILFEAEPVERVSLSAATLVLGATFIFSQLIDWLGLAVACVALVTIAAAAAPERRLVPILGLAVALTVFSILLFVYGLQLPLKVLPT